jgi:hypothetical protein
MSTAKEKNRNRRIRQCRVIGVLLVKSMRKYIEGLRENLEKALQEK